MYFCSKFINTFRDIYSSSTAYELNELICCKSKAILYFRFGESLI